MEIKNLFINSNLFNPIFINNNSSFQNCSKYQKNLIALFNKLSTNSIGTTFKYFLEIDNAPIYKKINTEIIDLYHKTISEQVNDLEDLNILERYDSFMRYIINIEMCDFDHSLNSSNNAKQIMCMDTSLTSSLNFLWQDKLPYHDLNILSGTLLSMLPKRKRSIERIFILYNIDKILNNNDALLKIYHILQEHLFFGIKVYCVIRSAIPQKIGILTITDELLNFHLIPKTLVDIMDISTLLSTRFLYKSSIESNNILENIEDLFYNTKKIANNSNFGFEVELGSSLLHLKGLLENLNMDIKD